jgi:hypothetical protein
MTISSKNRSSSFTEGAVSRSWCEIHGTYCEARAGRWPLTPPRSGGSRSRRSGYCRLGTAAPLNSRPSRNRDARADEIAFFVWEKLELTRNSRTITNPTGLILATVPQCFVGSTFEESRRRLERHSKLEAEEAERKRKQEAGSRIGCVDHEGPGALRIDRQRPYQE